MIKITSTNDEFRISLPFDQRFRAKRIVGYRWDPVLKLWRFPKTAASKQAILSEFGPEEIGDFKDAQGSSTNTKLVETNHALMKAYQDLIESHERIVDLWEVAEKFGLPEESNLGEFLTFTKASYLGNSEQASLATRLAVTEAKLAIALSELAKSNKFPTNDLDGNTFTSVLAKRIWGESGAPSAVADFSFDASGVIDLQNYLIKTLSLRLGRTGERIAFADLIREAEESKILSSSAARTCHSLRIQRNHFAHESVIPAEVFPRAMLCLSSFAVVYQDILRNQSND
ncbi:hypothetical protein [Thermomonas aquatica]|uniref:Uncharacterized protein n=1 Tax=Thermomonas aquatica TaxID=2202149 RepID=A0A5B7ZPB6_9GAMM|nr:hypothetical protein [Thermomonas aquatica]QDA56455.1 hypothetical protein FHQ07_03585 [Thermomonas aquatica]